MRSILNKFQTFGILIAILISTTSNIYGQDVIYVTKSGSPDPDGTVEKPYHVIQSAICKIQSVEARNIVIAPGKYYEELIVSTPCIITASSGSVIVGQMDYHASTSFDVLTLNTHLAGDVVFMPSWQDYERANDIADYIRNMNPMPDFVGFQEIWDEDLFKGGDGANGILPRIGSYFGKHGENSGILEGNSGLAIMSKDYLLGFEQGEFDDCTGVDCFAAKGWIKTTVNRNGFGIGVFNLHLQAEEGCWWVRIGQLNQLYNEIKEYQTSNSRNLVFIIGDFNIFGETGEYYDMITNFVDDLNGKDAHPNSPGFVSNTFDAFTVSNSNDLAEHFSEGTKNGRLDYILYVPSKDGACEIIPDTTQIVKFKGHLLSEDGLSTRQSSDHWAVYSRFKLIRR